MNSWEILLTAVSLSMDAFAVALCKGLALNKVKSGDCITVGLWFGLFQGTMPMLGYIFGSTFSEKIITVNHWIAFALLSVIGANMIKEAICKKEDSVNPSLGVKEMFVMAVATSIDALAAGVGFAFTDFEATMGTYIATPYTAFLLIGIITFIFCCAGVKIGNIFGTKFKTKAELTGGLILVGLGVKTLVEGMIDG